MCTPGAVDRACQWLNGVRLFAMDMSLSKSKQLHLIDSNNSKYCLADQSSSFVDCSNSRNHRFTSQKMAKMNRLQKPNKVLHYFNAPPAYTEGDIRQLCLSVEMEPVMIKIFPPRDAQAKTSSGLLEFKSIDEAIIVLTELNHSEFILIFIKY
jgi:heterogeneous nuclear ribonucleoprotein L